MIRQATKEDAPQIIEMVKAMCEELGRPCSEAYVVNLVTKCFKLAPCFLAEKDGKIIAMAGLSVLFCPFSGHATLSDYGFYIQPCHRSYGLFSGLIDKCKEYADEVNLPLRLNLQAYKDKDFAFAIMKRKGLNVLTVTGEYNGR